MTRQWIPLTEGDGPEAYLVLPEGREPAGAVTVGGKMFGVTAHVRDIEVPPSPVWGPVRPATSDTGDHTELGFRTHSKKGSSDRISSERVSVGAAP